MTLSLSLALSAPLSPSLAALSFPDAEAQRRWCGPITAGDGGRSGDGETC